MSYTHSILVTGGTAGLGFFCAQTLAKEHPNYLVVVSSRSDPNKAAEAINKATGQKNAQYLALDLSSLAKVRAFASTWTEHKFPPIIALVENAGLQFPYAVQFTGDGIESTFAINHVGHALLFHLLYPYLADNARIVLTSSGTHDPAQKSGLPDAVFNSAEEVAHPNPKTANKDGRERYSTSKLANVLWTYALDRRLKKATVSNKEKHLTVVAFDPGLMPGTGLAREYGAVARFVWNHVLTHLIWLLRLVLFENVHTPKESGKNLARLATSKDVEGVSGVYFEGRKEIKSSVDSYLEAKQEDLWEWSIQNVAINEEEKKTFDIGKV